MAQCTSLSLLTCLIVLFGLGQCQYPLQACCDQKLLDANRKVAVDTGRALTPGTYTALRLRLCTTDTVYIQLWTLLSDSDQIWNEHNAVQLKWQTTYTATSYQNTQIFVTVNLANPITITADDRLGLYGVTSGTGWNKVSIPYGLDSISGLVRFTETSFNVTDFTTGIQATLDSVQLPRTFSSFVQFCTASDCADLPPADLQATPQPTTSTCGCPITCTPDSTLKDSVSQQTNSIDQLADLIDNVNSQINDLTQTTISTGYCPTGSQAGAYGIGSCYYIVLEAQQYGEAAFRCAKLYNGTLLQINSLIENDFLYGLLLNISSSVTNYWTSGLYSSTLSQWQWFVEGRTSSPISATSYVNWQYNSVPQPTASSNNRCLALTIDLLQGQTYWRSADCSNVYAYVCELPKTCK